MCVCVFVFVSLYLCVCVCAGACGGCVCAFVPSGMRGVCLCGCARGASARARDHLVGKSLFAPLVCVHACVWVCCGVFLALLNTKHNNTPLNGGTVAIPL